MYLYLLLNWLVNDNNTYIKRVSNDGNMDDKEEVFMHDCNVTCQVLAFITVYSSN